MGATLTLGAVAHAQQNYPIAQQMKSRQQEWCGIPQTQTALGLPIIAQNSVVLMEVLQGPQKQPDPAYQQHQNDDQVKGRHCAQLDVEVGNHAKHQRDQ